MLDRNDELELLGLIEGELDAQAEAALRKRLANEPKALHAINRMKDDRAAMRAIPEPELPVDFLVQIESLLARPMLMEAQTSPVMVNPSALRRQHRRATRRIRWGRLAMVATLFIAVPAGIWAFASGLLTFNKNSSDLIAKSSGSESTSSVGIAATSAITKQPALPALTAADGTIHHYQPSPLPSHLADAMNGSNSTNSAAVASRHVLVAEFEVVLQSISDAGAQQSVQHAVASLGDHAALVRNFSFAEAARLDEEWRLAHGGARDGNAASPRIAGVDAPATNNVSQIKQLAERVRQHLSISAGASNSTAKSEESSGQIAGTKELAPTLEQQLDFSSRGAMFTVTVPAKQLRAFIEQLNLDQGQATALRMLSAPVNPLKAAEPAPVDALPPALQWIMDGPQVRKSIDRLSNMGENDVVLVPVSVRTDSPKNHKAEPSN